MNGSLRCLLLLFASLALLSPATALAQDVKVLALFTDKALLQVGDQQKVVSKGETFAGVLLRSASGRGAVVVIDDEEVRLGLNQSIAGNFSKPTRSAMRVYADAQGMYFVDGAINDQATRFLVDTGASFVTLSGDKARRLEIDFRGSGTPSSAQTAAAVVPVWQIRLDTVRVGGITVRGVDALVIPGSQPVEVLLGNSFLRHTRLEQGGTALEIRSKY